MEIRDKNGIVAKKGDYITFYSQGGKLTSTISKVKRNGYVEESGRGHLWLGEGDFEIITPRTVAAIRRDRIATASILSNLLDARTEDFTPNEALLLRDFVESSASKDDVASKVLAIIERFEDALAYDSHFDSGEFSGPALLRAQEKALAELAEANGLTYDELMLMLTLAQEEDNGCPFCERSIGEHAEFGVCEFAEVTK